MRNNDKNFIDKNSSRSQEFMRVSSSDMNPKNVGHQQDPKTI